MNQIRELLVRRLATDFPQTASYPTRTAAAVLVPFYQHEGEPHILFTKRSDTLQHHKNEISFPGGAQEANEDLLTTALRELQEEVAVPPDCVQILGRLDQILTYSSSFVVVPFVGELTNACFVPNPDEVQELLQVPLRELQDPSIFSEEKFVIEDRVVPVYYYRWKNHTIWGLTGRILKTLLDLIG